MAFKCSVFSCNSNSDKMTDNTISFFEFPSSPPSKQNWLNAIGRPYFKPVRSSRVCSKHFDKNCFVRNGDEVGLKEDAVPCSLNSQKQSTNSSRSSDGNVSFDDNKRRQNVTMPIEPPIGVKRPRRNTIFMGTYAMGKRSRTAASTLSGIDEHSAEESDTSTISKEPKKSTAQLSRNQSINLNGLGNRAIAANDTQGTNAVFKEPKKAAPIRSNNKSDIEKHPTKATQLTLNSSRGSDELTLLSSDKQGLTTNTSKEPPKEPVGLRPRRNTAYMGIYNLGYRRNRVAASTSTSQNQSNIEQPSTTTTTTVTTVDQRSVGVISPNYFDSRSVATSISQNQSNIERQSTEQSATVLERELNVLGIRSLKGKQRTRDSTKTLSPFTNNQPRIATPTTEPDILNRRERVLNKLVTAKPRPSGVSKVTRKLALIPISVSQTSIDKFFGKKSAPISRVVEPRESSMEDCIFGWTSMGSHAVPFIVQDSEKFCSLRILEKSALAKYKKRIPKIGRCHDNVECFQLTTVQCELLHEINVKHCDGAYGKERFTMRDKLVRLRDAFKYFTFVDLCHEAFMKGIRVQSEGLEFGFTLVNKNSYIPYTLLNARKLIPMNYLHCDDKIFDMLKGKSLILSDDKAMYLRFCCKFDGIEDVDGCNEVIDMAEIQQLAPPNTTFKDCWPADSVNYDLQLGVTTKGIRFGSVLV